MAFYASQVDGIQYPKDPSANLAPGVAIGGGINGSALTTTSTDGFLHIPVVAGAPSGVPSLITGFAPIVFDSTNNKIWIYLNSAWKGVVVA